MEELDEVDKSRDFYRLCLFSKMATQSSGLSHSAFFQAIGHFNILLNVAQLENAIVNNIANVATQSLPNDYVQMHSRTLPKDKSVPLGHMVSLKNIYVNIIFALLSLVYSLYFPPTLYPQNNKRFVRESP
jgi:hypothetical protein